MLIFILLLLLFFICQLHSHFLFDIIPHPSANYHHVFRPILYFQPSPSQSDSWHFYFSTIPLSSYRKRYGFEWEFFTHRRFLPYFWHIPDNLAQPAFIKVSLGGGSYFLESCKASYWSSKHRPGPSVCLIHSNIHLKSVFMHVNIAKVLLVVKTLIKNIDQQPHYSAAMKI